MARTKSQGKAHRIAKATAFADREELRGKSWSASYDLWYSLYYTRRENASR